MKEISFEDIRKGDTLSVRMDYERKGVAFLRNADGVASYLDRGAWFTEAGGQLASPDAVSITLLDRPKPPLPTTPGTVFRATEIRGEKSDVIMFVRVNGAFEDQRIYVSSHLVHGAHQHPAADITAWEPIEGVTA